MINMTYWYLPTTLSYCLIRNRFFFLMLHSRTLTCVIKLLSKPSFNKTTRVLTLSSLTTNLYSLATMFIETTTIQSTTIKFKGKGFKLIKNSTSLSLKFNFAHPQLFVPIKTITLKTGKNKIMFLNADTKKLTTSSLTLLKIRPTNIYTKNGLRLKRQILYRRKGKTLNT